MALGWHLGSYPAVDERTGQIHWRGWARSWGQGRSLFSVALQLGLIRRSPRWFPQVTMEPVPDFVLHNSLYDRSERGGQHSSIGLDLQKGITIIFVPENNSIAKW